MREVASGVEALRVVRGHDGDRAFRCEVLHDEVQGLREEGLETGPKKVPDFVAKQPQFVCFSDTKRPLIVRGGAASSTDAGTWASFDEAAASPAGISVGFVLGNGVGCIDLGHCIVGGVVGESGRLREATASALCGFFSRKRSGSTTRHRRSPRHRQQR